MSVSLHSWQSGGQILTPLPPTCLPLLQFLPRDNCCLPEQGRAWLRSRSDSSGLFEDAERAAKYVNLSTLLWLLFNGVFDPLQLCRSRDRRTQLKPPRAASLLDYSSHGPASALLGSVLMAGICSEMPFLKSRNLLGCISVLIP